jgi:N-acetyl-anhydromuramyl-L-alanine amidase AmpD
MPNPTTFYFKLDPAKRPPDLPLAETRIPEFKWFNTHRGRSRGVNPITGITTVVIHATAGWATQHAIDNWKIRNAGAHWIIPDEDEPQHGQFVWAIVSEALSIRHVKDRIRHPDLGDFNINHRSLGIEIVNSQNVRNYTDPYSDWQVQAAASIVRYCWAKYPNLRHVISHARVDPADRADPGKNFPWDKFKSLVLSDAHDPARHPLAGEMMPVSAFPDLRTGTGGCCP